MGLVLTLIVLAVTFGVIGSAVRALTWLLVIAVVLLVAGAIRGFAASRQRI